MRCETGAGSGQDPAALGVPDFGNLGVWLRTLLATCLGAALLAFDRGGGWAGFADDFVARAMLVAPVTLGTLALLGIGRRPLGRLPVRHAQLAVVAVAVAVAVLFAALLQPLLLVDMRWRAAAWAAAGSALLLAWFAQSARAREPALAEARLMALTARIRPHFLFNSLNAVLGTMRAEPRRAERALEELAELFRALMRDNRELVPLSDEIALARQYLEIERLRLGDKLKVRWEIDSCPPDALVPPLMLQPLLENAVYHGIEPAETPGELVVAIARDGKRVRIELTNPLLPGDTHHAGNRMALANIRERLLLFFDLEGELTVDAGDGFYRVRIVLPYRAERGT